MKNYFNVMLSIPMLDVENLLTCAFEGGSNYWYFDLRIVKQATRKCSHWTYAPLYGGVLALDTEDHRGVSLTAEKIARGLAIMAKNYPEHFADVLQDNTDATTGDVLLQCALFKDVIYG